MKNLIILFLAGLLMRTYFTQGQAIQDFALDSAFMLFALVSFLIP